jgi:hypothetical protein
MEKDGGVKCTPLRLSKNFNLGFVGGRNIDGKPVGRGLAPAENAPFSAQKSSVNGGSKPPPYGETVFSTA